MELEVKSNAGTSGAFPMQLRGKRPGPLPVIWDNAPAHRGEAVREYRPTPGLGPRLVNLPGYSRALNADEAIWGRVREEASGNLCLRSRSAVQGGAAHFWLVWGAVIASTLARIPLHGGTSTRPVTANGLGDYES